MEKNKLFFLIVRNISNITGILEQMEILLFLYLEVWGGKEK